MKHATSRLLTVQDSWESWDSTRLDSTRLCWCVRTLSLRVFF